MRGNKHTGRKHKNQNKKTRRRAARNEDSTTFFKAFLGRGSLFEVVLGVPGLR